jgi:multisubunit Na+/H+ antiporter MnhB subunit
MWLEEWLCFFIALIIGAYVFALLYLNAKVQPGRERLPERLKPLKYAVNSVGITFLALFLMVIGVLLLVLIYCLLTDCPRIE